MNRNERGRCSIFKIQYYIRGQALIESLVAMSAVSLGLVATLALLSRSIGLNRVVADNYAGTYLASEGVEVVKNILDRNVILNSKGIPTAWNEGVCNFPGGTSAFEIQYDTTDLAGVRIGDSGAVSSRKIKFEPTKFYQYLTGAETPFLRTVTADCNLSGGDEITVKSKVSWISRGGGSFNTEIEDHFYNWR